MKDKDSWMRDGVEYELVARDDGVTLSLELWKVFQAMARLESVYFPLDHFKVSKESGATFDVADRE